MDKSETSNKRQAKPRVHINQNEMKNFRSLICDESGIIIGEMVYRCLICSFISESMDKVRAHHKITHGDIEDISSGKFSYVKSEHCV
uniref:C2H2-type domain-containing protein n=1 Tax=Tetranychus urticae TaxID=32264 RepID=T1K1Z1_TETUR